ncbi:hypothetical protein ANCCEY_06797 [Ancylostoma ceylanicum]|uniref:Uncharacterized protein n=1 Tax=Ancylostoma ceylanicum TaxID=53326 RepID=A0A0D6LVL1_9BILA|nr:hypothetical protein ANCCEY_06797 [Ancylostoma ceylanicum]
MGVAAASFVNDALVNQSASSDSCQIYGLRALGSQAERSWQAARSSWVGLGYRFGGHGSHSAEESDHFKLLEADGDSLLVGARKNLFSSWGERFLTFIYELETGSGS